MADKLSRTAHSDAPLTAARNPDPSALGAKLEDAQSADVLVGRSVTIDRSRDELYAFWRNFENLATFMSNILKVTVTDATHSHGVVAAPAGRTVEWDSAITADEPGRLIAWHSLPEAQVRNSGRVEFKDSPDRRGTVGTVTMVYDPPAGTIGTLLAKLFHKEPKVQARRDLRRFKQLMETGEISTSAP